MASLGTELPKEMARSMELHLNQVIPGSSGTCPECKEIRHGWVGVYEVATINSFGVFPHTERAIGVICPVCKGEFSLPPLEGFKE